MLNAVQDGFKAQQWVNIPTFPSSGNVEHILGFPKDVTEKWGGFNHIVNNVTSM